MKSRDSFVAEYKRRVTSWTRRGVLCKLDIFVDWTLLDISNICSGNTKTPTVIVSKILNFTFYVILEQKDAPQISVPNKLWKKHRKKSEN